jgi:hypothetical protein
MDFRVANKYFLYRYNEDVRFQYFTECDVKFSSTFLVFFMRMHHLPVSFQNHGIAMIDLRKPPYSPCFVG